MGWYDANSNDWYKTNARPGAGNAQAASKLPNGSRKTRYAAIAACLVLLIIVIAYVISGFGVSSVDYNSDGRPPSDWHAYFDKLYGTEAPSAVSASVNIPLCRGARQPEHKKTALRALTSNSVISTQNAAPPSSASRFSARMTERTTTPGAAALSRPRTDTS